jgi:hypothetical protein
MGEVFNSWAQNSHNTYDFPAPVGDGLPYGLYFDAGIIKKDARPRIIGSVNSNEKVVVGETYTYTGQSLHYTDYENGVWVDGAFVTKEKIIKFYAGQIIIVYGTVSFIIHPDTPIQETIVTECYYIGRISYIYQPAEQETDGTFEDSIVSVVCVDIIKDTRVDDHAVPYWKISYAGTQNPALLDPAYDTYYNYVQNYNDSPKMAISGGRAELLFPEYASDSVPDIVTSDDGFEITTSRIWGARFTLTEEDEKHNPWSGITIGVSHLLNEETYIVVANPSFKTIAGQSDQYGNYTNYDIVEYAPVVSYSYNQEPVSLTYKFDYYDYELYKQVLDNTDPDANYLDIGGNLVTNYSKQTFQGPFSLGSYGMEGGSEESPPESFDNRQPTMVDETFTDINREFQPDFNLKVVDEETGQSTYDIESPYWNQVPNGTASGEFPNTSSDKFEFPDPYDFFYFEPAPPTE